MKPWKYPGKQKLYYDRVRNGRCEKCSKPTNGHKLVEDYPHFKDYSRIILIDWPYNQNVANPFMRISDPKKLAEVIL